MALRIAVVGERSIALHLVGTLPEEVTEYHSVLLVGPLRREVVDQAAELADVVVHPPAGGGRFGLLFLDAERLPDHLRRDGLVRVVVQQAGDFRLAAAAAKEDELLEQPLAV